MRKLPIILFFPTLFLILFCCKNTGCIEHLTQCLKKEVVANSKSLLGQEFLKQFKDTLYYQINFDSTLEMKRYREVKFYISDFCLFNSSNDMGICFVVKQRKTEEKLDFVDLFIGERNNNEKWIFSNKGAPSFSFQSKGSSHNIPIEKDSLINFTLEQLVRHNYYKNCQCEKNLDFFREILTNFRVEE